MYTNCIKCGHRLQTGDDQVNGLCTWCKCKSNQESEKSISPLYGWICPRCGVVHSPFSTQCGCPPPTKVSTGVSTDINLQP